MAFFFVLLRLCRVTTIYYTWATTFCYAGATMCGQLHMGDYTWVTTRGQLHVGDYARVTMLGRLCLDVYTWSTTSGQLCLVDYEWVIIVKKEK